MSRYINDKGQVAPAYLIDEQGRRVYHPTEAMLNAAGYHKVISPPLTLEEIRLQKLSDEKDDLISKLRDTDYKAIKHSEGWITDNEYIETKMERQYWRNRINEIEEELNQ